jgi:hypothetical protein
LPHGVSEPIGIRQPFPNSTAHPAKCLIDGIGGICQVENRRLDPSARRQQVRVPACHGVPHSMDDDTRNAGGVLVAWHGDVNGWIALTTLICETVQFSGSLVTQHGFWSSSDQGGP